MSKAARGETSSRLVAVLVTHRDRQPTLPFGQTFPIARRPQVEAQKIAPREKSCAMGKILLSLMTSLSRKDGEPRPQQPFNVKIGVRSYSEEPKAVDMMTGFLMQMQRLYTGVRNLVSPTFESTSYRRLMFGIGLQSRLGLAIKGLSVLRLIDPIGLCSPLCTRDACPWATRLARST
jgi:hypothetical protein